MTLNGFVKWLGKQKRRPWRLSPHERLLCEGRCPLQVLTGNLYVYGYLARSKFGLSQLAVDRIIEAADDYRKPAAQRLRARMLRAVGLLQ